jgi:hypothetical protein
MQKNPSYFTCYSPGDHAFIISAFSSLIGAPIPVFPIKLAAQILLLLYRACEFMNYRAKVWEMEVPNYTAVLGLWRLSWDRQCKQPDCN